MHERWYKAVRQGVSCQVSRAAREHGGVEEQVIVDVNWRPVFFEDPEKASEVVLPYAQQADILKMTDEEADWLLAIPPEEALDHPSKVAPALVHSAHVCVLYNSS